MIPDVLCVSHLQLLSLALGNPPLRDELYCQVIKQLTSNIDATSVQRLWQLMMLSLCTFPPSEALENYLEVYLRGQDQLNCVLALHRIVYNGPRDAIPTPSELEAFLGFATAKPGVDVGGGGAGGAASSDGDDDDASPPPSRRLLAVVTEGTPAALASPLSAHSSEADSTVSPLAVAFAARLHQRRSGGASTPRPSSGQSFVNPFAAAGTAKPQ